MSITHINKALVILSCLFFLSACISTKSVYKNFKTQKYNKPLINIFDDQNITLSSLNSNKIKYENKITLSELIKNNQYQSNIIINDNKFFALNKDNNIMAFDINTGQLIETTIINIDNIANENIVSFNFLNNSFIIAIKSGSIINIDLTGELIWNFESNNTLNTPLYILDKQIIALYVDQIINISSKDGKLIWDENYKDLPVYQSQGGQMVNFLNLLFFILPNNRVGSMDLSFGSEHNFIFNQIPLISSINNTEDKIHIFDNYFTYLDEGKYLYTADILGNNFNLFKKNINTSSSNIFFNNSLIIKGDTYLHAINIRNGKSFWLIENKDISPKSTIVSIRSFDNNIEVFLSNGDVLTIRNRKLIEINNLNVKNIKKIFFDKKNIIVITDSGKTVIF